MILLETLRIAQLDCAPDWAPPNARRRPGQLRVSSPLKLHFSDACPACGVSLRMRDRLSVKFTPPAEPPAVVLPFSL